MKAIEQYVFRLAECYTKMPEVSRLRTGSKGGKEGAEIRAAIASLNAINEFLALKEDEHIDDQQRIEFVKRCLATKGDLVDGMRKLFSGNSIVNIRKTFRLPGNVKKTDSRFNSDISDLFFNAMLEKSAEQNLIGQLIETCFDFPYKQYAIYDEDGGILTPGNAKKLGLKNKRLEEMTSNASQSVAFTLGAFNKIQITDSIINSFISTVINNQGWNKTKITERNFEKLLRDIKGNLSGFLYTELSALNTYYDDKEKARQEIRGRYAECVASERTNKDYGLTK